MSKYVWKAIIKDSQRCDWIVHRINWYQQS